MTSNSAGEYGTVVVEFQRDEGSAARDAVRDLCRHYDRMKIERDHVVAMLRIRTEIHDAAHGYLTSLGIPTHCASGEPLTLGQRLVLATWEDRR